MNNLSYFQRLHKQQKDRQRMSEPNDTREEVVLPLVETIEEDNVKIRAWMEDYPHESSSFWSVQLRLLVRERQLKAALSANREKDAEIEWLKADVKMWKHMVEDSSEHQLAVSEGALHARQGKTMNPSYSASGKLNYAYQSAYEDVQNRIAAEAELASLRASGGEKWIEIKEGCEMPLPAPPTKDKE